MAPANKRPRDQRSAEADAYRWMYGTAAWKAARRQQLDKQPLCERHLSRGEIVPATIVHHPKPHKGDWALFIDPENHASSCAPCHDGPEQIVDRRGFSKEIGADGFPVDPRHPANR